MKKYQIPSSRCKPWCPTSRCTATFSQRSPPLSACPFLGHFQIRFQGIIIIIITIIVIIFPFSLHFHNAIPTNDNMIQVGRKPCMLLPFIGHTFIAGVLIINIIIILIILIIAVIMSIKTMIIVGQTITIRVLMFSLITAGTYCRC